MSAALLTLALTTPSHAEGEPGFKLVKGVRGELMVDEGAVKHASPIIKDLFSQMQDGLDTPQGISLVDASFRKDGTPWMEAAQVLDGLIVIGIAAGVIEFVKARADWGEPKTWPQERIRYVKRAG